MGFGGSSKVILGLREPKNGSGPKNNVFLAKKIGSGKDKASLLIEIIRYGVKKI